MPFREAHEVVGRLVLRLEREGRTLQDLCAGEYAEIHSAFGADTPGVVEIRAVVERRDSEGGTGHAAVAVQIERASGVLAADAAWLEAAGE
jgi:argininosuccinate lyase